jgi:hypothetical protein
MTTRDAAVTHSPAVFMEHYQIFSRLAVLRPERVWGAMPSLSLSSGPTTSWIAASSSYSYAPCFLCRLLVRCHTVAMLCPALGPVPSQPHRTNPSAWAPRRECGMGASAVSSWLFSQGGRTNLVPTRSPTDAHVPRSVCRLRVARPVRAGCRVPRPGQASWVTTLSISD